MSFIIIIISTILVDSKKKNIKKAVLIFHIKRKVAPMILNLKGLKIWLKQKKIKKLRNYSDQTYIKI